MSDKAASQKTRSPEGCDENGPAVALLLSHVSIQICSFVASCGRPILIATPLHQSLTWCTRTSNSIKRTWCRTLSQPSFENYSGSQDLFLLLEITLSEFFPLPEGLPTAW